MGNGGVRSLDWSNITNEVYEHNRQGVGVIFQSLNRSNAWMTSRGFSCFALFGSSRRVVDRSVVEEHAVASDRDRHPGTSLSLSRSGIIVFRIRDSPRFRDRREAAASTEPVLPRVRELHVLSARLSQRPPEYTLLVSASPTPSLPGRADGHRRASWLRKQPHPRGRVEENGRRRRRRRRRS